MSVLLSAWTFLNEWYLWFLGVPAFTFVAGLLWRYRKEIGEYLMFFWGIKQRLERLEGASGRDKLGQHICPACLWPMAFQRTVPMTRGKSVYENGKHVVKDEPIPHNNWLVFKCDFSGCTYRQEEFVAHKSLKY